MMTPEPCSIIDGSSARSKANGRHQVPVQFLPPFGIVKRSETAAGSTRASQHIDQDVDPTQLLQNGFGCGGTSLGRRKIGGDVVHAFDSVGRQRASDGDYFRAGIVQDLYDSSADTFRAAGDECTTVR